MNRKEKWSMVVQASNESAIKPKTRMLLGVVVGVHVLALGGFLFIGGCGTHRSATTVQVEPPPAPVMPPRDIADPVNKDALPKPDFQPSVKVEQVSATSDGTDGQMYEIKSGDTLSKIASRCGVTVRELQDLNKIKDPSKLLAGQKLMVPAHGRVEAAPVAAKPAPVVEKKVVKPAAKKAGKPAKAEGGTYVVKSGDSLSKVASTHGTSVKALQEANHLKGDVIRIGQKLVVPGAKAEKVDASAPVKTPAPVKVSVPEEAPEAPVAPPTETPVTAAPVTIPLDAVVNPVTPPPPAAGTADSLLTDIPFEYTVKPNEQLDDVARKFAVMKQSIMDLNGISDPAAVKDGMKLKIPLSSP